MFWVYIIESEDGSWYIGQTENLKRRIAEHKGGYGSKTTAKKHQWRCIYCEGYLHHKDALGRERYLKSGSGRKYITKQLKHFFEES